MKGVLLALSLVGLVGVGVGGWMLASGDSPKGKKDESDESDESGDEGEAAPAPTPRAPSTKAADRGLVAVKKSPPPKAKKAAPAPAPRPPKAAPAKAPAAPAKGAESETA